MLSPTLKVGLSDDLLSTPVVVLFFSFRGKSSDNTLPALRFLLLTLLSEPFLLLGVFSCFSSIKSFKILSFFLGSALSSEVSLRLREELCGLLDFPCSDTDTSSFCSGSTAPLTSLQCFFSPDGQMSASFSKSPPSKLNSGSSE
ncbi:LOW QUALITY PROTEIN: hypothetical protein TorRG33x02_023690 [Trema orientale]|uniref:Uncharacterized protein n=1 Tax=Trema orientale TaxID=63057 RepID=A0A2P5FUX4_TREOI|nr:LOW QUALITY PROTEIN: hypothetical protein TorRG33x02_023690 [Trema orientale]